MAKSREHLEVMVASPSDLGPERKIVKVVIDELNNSIAGRSGYHLDLLTWEDSVYPAFGDDGQDVINRQIGNEYDIFIGIMWARFGTSTLRSDSGSKEEFEIAYNKYQNNDGTDILMYFKTAGISPQDIDIEQLKQVNQFRDDVSKKGGLYKQFASAEEFEKILRINLTQLIGVRRDRSQPKQNAPIQAEKTEGQITDTSNNKHSSEVLAFTNTNIEDDESPEILDVIIASVDDMSELTQSLSRSTDLIDALGTTTNKRTDEFIRIERLPEQQKLILAKRLVDGFAEDIEQFVLRMEVELGITEHASTKTVEMFSYFLSENQNLPDLETQRQELKAAIFSLDESITTAISSISGMRRSFETIDTLTKNFRVAKRKALKLFDDLIIAYGGYKNLLQQFLA